MKVTDLDITSFPGLVSFWDFQDDPYRARGAYAGVLQPMNGVVPVADEGVFGPRSLRFGGGAYLTIRRKDLGPLNICGPAAQVSIVAWIKRLSSNGDNTCQAVAGIWNEHALRQYCLFLNLGIWDSAQQVCGHFSNVGGATPGYKYCMDAAIGATRVPLDEWVCCGVTYDGTHARAYLNGRLDERPRFNPYHYPGGIFDGGPNGADLTVGAVARPNHVDDQFQSHGSAVANNFYGLLGGLAIFDRSLGDDEMARLAAR